MPTAGPAAGGEAAESSSSHFLYLHGDLLRRCLQPLAHRDLLAASAVCREWREASNCELIWEERYLKDFRRSKRIVGSRSGGSSLGCPSARLFPHALPQLPDGAAGPAAGANTASDTWRRAYRERLGAEANWRAGRSGWQRLVGHRDYIRCAQLVDGVLASCSGSYLHKDCSIRLWDVGSGQCLEHMRGHEGPIWSMHFDGARVASCDDEGAVRLWDLDTHRVGVSAALAPCSLKCVGVDGRQLAAAGESGLLGLWSLAGIQRALEEAEESEDADMSGEGSSSDVEDGSDEEDNPRRRQSTWRPVRLDSAAGAAAARARAPQLHMLANPAPDTSCLQLDSGLCATGDSGADGQVHLWSTEDDELDFKCSLAGHPHGVATLSFQRETGWLVAGSGGGPVKVWSMERSTLLHDLRGHAASVLCHQQSGTQLATGGADCALRLWDLRAGRTQAVLPLGSLPYCLQMDDWRLAVGCGNGTVQLVDLRRPASSAAGTGSSSEAGGQGTAPSKLQARTVLPAHRERVWALALDATRLVSASLDASIVVRSFLPADVATHEARRLQQGDSEAEGSELELGSDEEEELDEEGEGSEGSGGSETDSAADMDSDGEDALAADGGWASDGEGQQA